MAYSVLVLAHGENSTDMAQIAQAPTTEKGMQITKLCSYLNSLALGTRSGQLVMEVGNVQATGTITFSGVGQANDTILINGVTFTAKASGATGNEWNVAASATLSAAALAAAINASASALVSGHVTAAAVSGVVTITAKAKGVYGNAVTIAEGVDGLSHMAVSGARLTGGTSGTAYTYTYGSYV